MPKHTYAAGGSMDIFFVSLFRFGGIVLYSKRHGVKTLNNLFHAGRIKRFNTCACCSAVFYSRLYQPLHQTQRYRSNNPLACAIYKDLQPLNCKSVLFLIFPILLLLSSIILLLFQNIIYFQKGISASWFPFYILRSKTVLIFFVFNLFHVILIVN